MATKNKKIRETKKRKERRSKEQSFIRKQKAKKQELLNCVIKNDNKLLYQRSNKLDYKDDIGFIHKMVEALNAHETGVGLAASQIGVLKSVIVIDPKKTLNPTIMVNPEIIWQSEEKATDTEGCLSYPGVSVKVERSKNVKVKYLNMKGFEEELLADEYTSRVILHEIDHINGICAVGDEYYRENEKAHPSHNESIYTQSDCEFISCVNQSLFSCGKKWLEDEMEDMQEQLSKISNDPNLTIVTHFPAFDEEGEKSENLQV